MRRLLPTSLLGQVMLSVALALLVAQVVSAVLLYRAGEERREAAIMTAAAFQLVNGAEEAERRAELREARDARRTERGDQSRTERLGDRLGERRDQRREARREARRAERRGERSVQRQGQMQGQMQEQRITPQSGSQEPPTPAGLPRRLRYTVTPSSPISPSETTVGGPREERLRAILAADGITPYALAVTIRRTGDDPVLLDFAQDRPRFNQRSEWRERNLFVIAIQREADGPWETARILDPQRPRAALGVLFFQTLVTFAFLIVILFLVLRRITRPLAELTERVSDFSRQPDRAVLLEESGPSDTRRLIAAHNTMEARIAALLDEKNVMLGAIGHDLKSPLAALRVRIESVADDAQRQKMAASIEDITVTLDDILALARVGHVAAQEREPVDIGALASGVAEEFEDLGEPVTIADLPAGKRVVARVQETWAKRALRNLVSNAVRYGEAAEITVFEDGGQAVLRVDDVGPGIPAGNIAAMMEPFTRGEASRNRATGGAGLGLTLARAIAEQHDGELVLTNRNEKGLRAELRLPL